MGRNGERNLKYLVVGKFRWKNGVFGRFGVGLW